MTFPEQTRRHLMYGADEGGHLYGPAMLENLRRIDAATVSQWGWDRDATAGLTYGYFGGVVIAGAVHSLVNDGTLTLADDDVNYVERSTGGTVSVNQTEFTPGAIPMAVVTTAHGVIDDHEDWRVQYGSASSGPPAAHDLVGASHSVAGLTAGWFLKALTATTFGFAAHGLTYSDVGAASTSDARLSDARVASDVYAWAKAAAKPSYTYSEVGAEASGAVATHAALTTGVHGLLITAGQTLTVTTGGTLGSAAYTASTAYDVAGAAAAVTPTTLGLVIGTNVLAYRTFGTAANSATTDFDVAGAAATVAGNLSTHAGLTTTAHGLGASAFHADAFFALASHAHAWADITSGVPTTWTPIAHNLTSAYHGDTVAGSVARGDLLVGNATPKWAALAFPATPTGKVVVATATDVAWSAAALGTAAWAATGDFAAASHNHAWSALTSGVPTTISGYGITDFNSLGDARWSPLAGSSSIVTVGALNAGSITSGFGAIDIGADALTCGAITATTASLGGAPATFPITLPSNAKLGWNYASNAASREWTLNTDSSVFGDFVIATTEAKGGAFLGRMLLNPSGAVTLGSADGTGTGALYCGALTATTGTFSTSLMVGAAGAAYGVAEFVQGRIYSSDVGKWAQKSVWLTGSGYTGDIQPIHFGYSGTTYVPAAFAFLVTGQTGYSYGDFVWYLRAVDTDTQPTEKMRLSSAGALTLAAGLSATTISGTTGTFLGQVNLQTSPAPWSDAGRFIESGAGTAFGGGIAWGLVTTSAYYNAGWKFANSSYGPTKYEAGQGEHTFSVAASGTAGTAITFVDALRIGVAGGVGIGVAPPATLGALTLAAGLSATTISGTTGTFNVAGADNTITSQLFAYGAASGAVGAYRTAALYLGRDTGTANYSARIVAKYFSADHYGASLLFQTHGGASSTSYTDAMTLDLGGNMAVLGHLACAGAFGCNSQAPQTAYASGGALAAYGTGVFGFDSGANASALYAMVVAIRAALVADGIMS